MPILLMNGDKWGSASRRQSLRDELICEPWPLLMVFKSSAWHAASFSYPDDARNALSPIKVWVFTAPHFPLSASLPAESVARADRAEQDILYTLAGNQFECGFGLLAPVFGC
jgi:hypothetical protein